MKRYSKIFLILVLIIILCGCENTSNYEMITCTKSVTTSNNENADLKYEIYYEGDYVKKTISTEVVTSDNNDVLKEYKSSYEKAFEPYKDIKYYDNDVTIKRNTVTSKTIIDYTRVNTKKIVDIEGENGNIFTTDGKLKLKTLLDTYKKYGSNCDD